MIDWIGWMAGEVPGPGMGSADLVIEVPRGDVVTLPGVRYWPR